MVGFLRFIAGLFLGTVFLLGLGSLGYNIFQEFGFLTKLIIAAIGIVLLLNITAFTSFPRSINIGLITPQIALLMGGAFYYSQKELSLYFTDDFTYRSCVGNFDHKQGIIDCTSLLNKLETKGRIVLKEIENTEGDYWLSEMLSYRGRHHIKNDNLQLGKEDFAKALFIPDGLAVTVNNLAEAGFTRTDLFQEDYESLMTEMSDNSRCLAASSKLKQQSDAQRFSSLVSSKTLDAVKLCRLTTGRDEAACDKIVSDRIRSIISLSNRLYVDSSPEEIQSDHAQCIAR